MSLVSEKYGHDGKLAPDRKRSVPLIASRKIPLRILLRFAFRRRKCLQYGNPYCNFQFSRTGTRTASTGNWSTGSGTVAKDAVMCLCIKITVQKFIIVIKIMLSSVMSSI